MKTHFCPTKYVNFFEVIKTYNYRNKYKVLTVETLFYYFHTYTCINYNQHK